MAVWGGRVRARVCQPVSVPIFVRRLVPRARPRTTIGVTSGAIGPEAGLAIGAAVASRAPTVLIQCDGGFAMALGELATMVDLAADIVVMVFNDCGYGAIRMLEESTLGRTFATDLKTPDFVAVAQAVDMPATRVTSSAMFPTAFEQALATPGPFLIDVDLTAMPSTSPIEWRRRSAQDAASRTAT
jgi:acetolactate synthase-1/2/3 large subunit